MNPDPMFTDPPASVQRARVAMARAQRRLALDLHPLDPCCDLTGIGLAFLNLEALYPPFPPLVDVDPSVDPQSDITDALRFLGAAIAHANTAADVARYAATIADLSDLDLLADDSGSDLDEFSAQWRDHLGWGRPPQRRQAGRASGGVTLSSDGRRRGRGRRGRCHHARRGARRCCRRPPGPGAGRPASGRQPGGTR